MLQEQYWIEIYQLKTHIGFLELQLEEAEGRVRIVKILLAIASSTSIGAWAIWQSLSWLWASIIAFSQVVAAISPYLPYKNRIKAYTSLIQELEELMIQAEFKWHAIADGRLTPKDINKARFDIRAAKNKSLKKHIQTTIPSNSKLHEKAEDSAKEYFSEFYPA